MVVFSVASSRFRVMETGDAQFEEGEYRLALRLDMPATEGKLIRNSL